MDNTEEQIYAIAGQELATKTVRQGVFAKAYALAGGDEAKAKAHYITLRVEQLRLESKDEAIRRARQEKEQAHAKESDRIAKEEAARLLVCDHCASFEATGVIDKFKGHCHKHQRETYTSLTCPDFTSKPINGGNENTYGKAEKAVSTSHGSESPTAIAATGGILGLFSIFAGVFTGLPAVVLGHIAMLRISKNSGRRVDRGLAIFALITGYIALALFVFGRLSSN